LQPAVHKFAGITYSNPPTSGEVKDDNMMDLYYSRMQEEYALCSHTYSKDMPKTFCKMMKAHYFLSKHPKFKIEFPVDGAKPPTRHPSTVRKISTPVSQEDFTDNLKETSTFVRVPNRKGHPASREHSKRVDVINLVVDKVSQKVSATQNNPPMIQEMWRKIEGAIEVTGKHMRSLTHNQIMANAPIPIKRESFDNLFRSIVADMERRAIEAENSKKQVELKRESSTKKKDP
jgi:hypothetical protein